MILLVDDDEGVRGSARRILERAGYRVAAVETAAEALAQAAAHPIELVITDIYMPDMDGIELIQSLRASGGTWPILAISGGAAYEHGSLEDARLLGADATLEKPFTPAELKTAVAALLPGRPAGT